MVCFGIAITAEIALLVSSCLCETDHSPVSSVSQAKSCNSHHFLILEDGLKTGRERFPVKPGMIRRGRE